MSVEELRFPSEQEIVVRLSANCLTRDPYFQKINQTIAKIFGDSVRSSEEVKLGAVAIILETHPSNELPEISIQMLSRNLYRALIDCARGPTSRL